MLLDFLFISVFQWGLAGAAAATVISEMIGVPPVPIINPMALAPIRNGIIRLTAANAVLPTKLDTRGACRSGCGYSNKRDDRRTVPDSLFF